MQDDGNLVIYNGVGRPVWASNTYQRGKRLTNTNILCAAFTQKEFTPTVGNNFSPFVIINLHSQKHEDFELKTWPKFTLFMRR